MRHHQTIDENRKALRRVVAVLLALAGLLDRAAGRSGAVCFLVVWLLRPGEAVARDYLDGLAPGAAGLAEPLRPGAPESYYGAAEALPANRLSAGLIELSAPATRRTRIAAVGRFDSS